MTRNTEEEENRLKKQHRCPGLLPAEKGPAGIGLVWLNWPLRPTPGFGGANGRYDAEYP